LSSKYRIVDKRGHPLAYTLFEGSRPAPYPRQSQIYQWYASDIKQQMTTYDWRQLLSAGRFLYANIGAVAGAVNERGTYAVGEGWQAQYVGSNKKWGDKAEEWLYNWQNVCDVRGTPYDFTTNLFLTSVSIDRCGDNAMLLTESEDSGYPQVQFIPAHRIGSRSGSSVVEKGPYKGLETCNGVVFNGQQRAVAYEVLGYDDQGKDDRYVSARDMQLNFSPYWFDQGRGISALANAVRDWQDYRDIRDFEKIGIKTVSETAVVEQNEKGSADPGEEHFEAGVNAQGKNIYTETMEGGAIRYFRANSGSGLNVIRSERPSSETQNFIQDQIMRGAFAGMGWPIEFSWNPEKLGGANVRMVVEKAERSVKRIQKQLALVWRRATYYAVAKGIKNGFLPDDPDWFMWDAQLPKSLTVDAGYASQADIDEYRIGFRTLSEIYGKRGLDWQSAIRQRIAERKFLLEELQASGTGIKPEEIQMMTPNGNKPDAAEGKNHE
jgi:lambda family portal protein